MRYFLRLGKDTVISKAFDEMFTEDHEDDDQMCPEDHERIFDDKSTKKDHECEEGMTEISGWMICKHCGDNLRKIK